MGKIINLHIEKLPEGFYLATSEDVQGLVIQGRTVSETLEIARDVARKLLDFKVKNKIHNVVITTPKMFMEVGL